MEAILQYLDDMQTRGIRLNELDGNIKYHAPKGALTAADIQFLKTNKPAVIKLLKQQSGAVAATIDAAGHYQPFPLTGIQEAYLLGRSNTYQLGGVSCHIYLELEYPALDPNQVEAVWNDLVERHGMLRTVFSQQGYQQELTEVPHFQILRGGDEADGAAIRKALADKMYPVDRWPLFDIGVSGAGTGSILHFSTEFLILDWTSIWMLLAEFEDRYFRGNILPPLQLHFRDYVLAEKRLSATAKYRHDQQYWLNQIAALPAAPKLPKDPGKQLQNRFRRLQLEIAQEQWEQLKTNCKTAGITPTSLILTLYAKVLARYGETADFSINMIMLNRHPLHQEVNQIVGDFTSNTLIPISMAATKTLQEEGRLVNQAVFEALDHGYYSGVEILRELSRQKGREAAFMPIIFTSAIGVGSQHAPLLGVIRNTGISQTPQAYVDCQVMDGAFGLRINWDVREGVFYDGYLEDMFQAFETAALAAAAPASDWNVPYQITLPGWQLAEREAANQTALVQPVNTLHQLVLEQAEKTPDLLAAADARQQYSYRELVNQSKLVAARINAFGLAPGAHIGIVMPKHIDQIVAVLAALFCGGVFVPVDDSEAFDRTETIIRNAQIDVLLVHSSTRYQSQNVRRIVVDQVTAAGSVPDVPVIPGDPAQPAYIIHTSGSTGIPKGVVISHQAAINTIADINRRFAIGSGDRVLGLSQLNFDLSVYDIFGMLSTGGAVIYPDSDKTTDPSHWTALLEQYQISVWNTVPSLLVMLQEYLQTRKYQTLDFVKAVMLSGDWIPLALPDQIQPLLPKARIISLGGATEASIWSVFHEYQGRQPDWVSIPYGKPLANQQMNILNARLEPSPVWLKGDIYISGDGLAEAYYGDPEKTAQQFFEVPSLGRRAYRTGDQGRYRPGGEIEFLGREDKQVKILGFRIELGEIEAALKQYPGVSGAMVFTAAVGNMTKIIGGVWGNGAEFDETVIHLFLKDKLPSYMLPYRIVTVASVPLTANGKVDRGTIETEIRHRFKDAAPAAAVSSGESGSRYTEQVRAVVCSTMELPEIGLDDDLYRLGADSLVMNRIAVGLTEVFSQYCDFEAVLTQLLNAPTIAAFSQFITQESEEPAN